MEGMIDLGILSTIETCVKNKKGDFSSAFAKKEQSAIKNLDKLPGQYTGS
jgi:hypothetical protein